MPLTFESSALVNPTIGAGAEVFLLEVIEGAGDDIRALRVELTIQGIEGC